VHFGEDDTFLPVAGARALESAVADRADITVHIHAGAGHAFDNHEAAMFHHPEASAEAWDQTTAFLNRHLPAR
jgi:carboxymethylenebutenolidase